MPKTLEEYIKEFGNHLLKRGKSKATVINYTLTVRQLLEYTNKTPKTLNLSDLEDFAYHIRNTVDINTQRSKLTGVKRYLRFIKRAYKNQTYEDYEEDKEDTGDDILKVTANVDTQRIPLTKKEVKNLLKISESNPRDHAMLTTFYYTAQRVGSIVNLNLGDIDFKGKIDKNGNRYHSIVIRNAKGGRTFTIEVPSKPIDAIKEYLKVREEPKDGHVTDNYGNRLEHSDAVFLNGWGQRMSKGGIHKMVSKYAVLSGIKKKVYPHLFRHTAITHMDSNGMSDAEMKKLSGHSKLSNAINIYKNPDEDDTRAKCFSALSLDTSKKKTNIQPPQTTQVIPTEIRIKELELELLKLKKQKENENRELEYYS